MGLTMQPPKTNLAPSPPLLRWWVLGSAVIALAARPAVAGPLFGSPVPYVTAGYAYAVAIADLNEDGRPDLVVGNLYSTKVSVLLGNGDGTFQPERELDLGVEPGFVTVGD